MPTGELVYESADGEPTTLEIDDDHVWYDSDAEHWVVAREWADRGGNTPVTYVPVRRVLSVTVTYNVMRGERVPSPPEDPTADE
jgi:hypothetical protein